MATFRNQATLSYGGITTTSNVVVGEITQTLAAEKHAPRETFTPGENITYIVSLTNGGTTPFTNLTVSDDLGGYTFGGGTAYPLAYVPGSAALYVDGVLTETVTVTPGPPLTFSGINVPAGGNAVLVYEATATAYADPTGEDGVTNTATVTGGGISTPLTADETVRGTSGVNLSITKALFPVPVAENGRLSYTFTIENTGTRPTVATDNVTVTDVFDPILTDIIVTLNGEVLTAVTDYTYNESTGIFTTRPGVITVPAATTFRDPVTGAFVLTPGTVTLVVSGTV